MLVKISPFLWVIKSCPFGGVVHNFVCQKKMFRNPDLLEKIKMARYDLSTPLTFPLNTQKQDKTGWKIFCNSRNQWFDWYNAYFRVNYTLEATNNGNGLSAATTSSTLNGSASLINKLVVKSAGKTLYNIDNAHKAVFVKNLLDFSDDYARTTATSQFWYLDEADDVVLDNNKGIAARQKLTKRVSEAGNAVGNAAKVVETIIPLNRYSFFENLEDKILPPMQLQFEITFQNDEELIWQNDPTDRRVVVRNFELWVPTLQFTSVGQKLVNENFLKPAKWKFLNETIHSSTARKDASGMWQISPGVKNAKHVFVWIQRSGKANSYEGNPFIFDTFSVNAANDAACQLTTCRLQSGANNFTPELEYASEFKERILRDASNFRYRTNDYNTGTQLNIANYSTIYPLIYFDLRADKTNLTNDPQQLIFHYRLSQAATPDYTIYAIVMNEEEIVVDKVGGEIVVV